jgi:hypothetical protein
MKMKMEVKKEEAAFEMLGRSYDGDGELVEVSYADLRAANIGDMWEARDTHNCGRALDEESAEVVYKTERGAAVLFRNWGTTDDPNPEHWASAPKLVWYEFA